MKDGLRTEKIRSKLRELKDSLYYVGSFLPSDYALLDNRKDKNALYKEVEFAIQLIIDICAIIHSDIGKTTPSDEDSLILEVGREKVVSELTVNKILLMKGFRNILVHKYEKIDDKKAYEAIKEGLDDFELIIKEIEKFLEEHEKKERAKDEGKKKRE